LRKRFASMSGKLDFLRPIYDIALWQFLIMGRFLSPYSEEKVVMTYRMHEVVANIMCKLLTLKAFEVS